MPSIIVTNAGGYSYEDYPVPNYTKPPQQIIAHDEVTGIDITNNNEDRAH